MVTIESPLAAAGLIGLALIGIVYGAIPHAAPAVAGPILYSFTMLADVATSMTLLFVWQTPKKPRSLFVLALSFAASGALTALTLLAVPLLPQIAAAVSNAPPGIWLYTLSHVTLVIGTPVYLGFRKVAEALSSRRFVVCGSVVAAVALSGAVAALFLLGHRLPQLANGTSLTGFRFGGVGLALIAGFAVNAFLVLRLREPSTIDRALAFAQLAFGLDVLVMLLHGDRYSMSFYCARGLQLAGSTFVLIAVLQTLLRSRGKIERDLRNTERESANRAARISALWQIGATQELPGEPEARFARMLAIAAAAIRPGIPFAATLSHLDRGSLVFDAVAGIDGTPADPSHLVIRTGAVLPLATTVQSLLYADGVTQAWNDIEHSALAGTTIAVYLGTRSMIGSPLQIGRQTHFIVFSSPEPMIAAPFDPSDIAYVDVVASLFSSSVKQIENVARLRFQMEHDALTGLCNRVTFRKAIRAQIAGGQPFVIAIVNLSDFRGVNQVHGQMLADEVLVEIGAALAAVEPDDLVARLSGDEFGVLIRRIGESVPPEALLVPYEAPFRRPFYTGDRDGTQTLSVDARLGAARFPEDGATPEELIHAAGVALHVARDRGGRSTVVYERAMAELVDQRRVATVDIANAIAYDQLRLAYQPTFDLETRAIVGAEALVRWDHPVKGEIPPADFIPTAEKYGVIGDISRWVFRRLLRDLSVQAMPPGFRCYFNLSTQDIDDAFVAVLTEALSAHPQLSGMLGVEITESGIMKNIAQSRGILDRIRLLGLRVAIDDFGTGHSSLSYLKQLSVDMIKIDRSFVTGLPGNETDAALTESMIAICARLNLVTLAEGIETEEQCAWLRAHGCRYGQGYLIARPLPFAELLARLPKAREAAVL